MNHDDKSLGVMSHHRGEKHFRLGVGRNTSEFTKGLRGKKKKKSRIIFWKCRALHYGQVRRKGVTDTQDWALPAPLQVSDLLTEAH